MSGYPDTIYQKTQIIQMSATKTAPDRMHRTVHPDMIEMIYYSRIDVGAFESLQD
jgi:hypothetical protein